MKQARSYPWTWKTWGATAAGLLGSALIILPMQWLTFGHLFWPNVVLTVIGLGALVMAIRGRRRERRASEPYRVLRQGWRRMMERDDDEPRWM